MNQRLNWQWFLSTSTLKISRNTWLPTSEPLKYITPIKVLCSKTVQIQQIIGGKTIWFPIHSNIWSNKKCSKNIFANITLVSSWYTIKQEIHFCIYESYSVEKISMKTHWKVKLMRKNNLYYSRRGSKQHYLWSHDVSTKSITSMNLLQFKLEQQISQTNPMKICRNPLKQ